MIASAQLNDIISSNVDSVMSFNPFLFEIELNFVLSFFENFNALAFQKAMIWM